MTWIQFPFPECPQCHKFWVASRHSGCGTEATVELDPDRRVIRCQDCSTSWQVWETTFRCSCGNKFTSADVEDAIKKIIEAAGALAQALAQQREEILAIRRAGKSSFDSWLSTLAKGLGHTLGGAVGSIASWILKQFS